MSSLISKNIRIAITTMIKEVNSQQFQEEVLSSRLPVLVDFWAPWCAPCMQLLPIIEEVASQYKEKINFVKLNVQEEPSIASNYMVMSIPTLIVFKDGSPCDRKSGYMAKEEIEKLIFHYISC